MLKGKCRLLDSIIWLYNKSVEIEKPFDVCDEVFEYDDSVALFFLKKGFLPKKRIFASWNDGTHAVHIARKHLKLADVVIRYI